MPYSDLDVYRTKAQLFDFEGKKVAYWQAGQGPDLVLVHGFPSAAWDWHTLWDDLAKNYRVTAFDLLGYGISDKPHPHQYSLIEQAKMTISLLQHLSIRSAHFLAHDYGNSVTQEVLAQYFNQEIELEMHSVCFLNGGLFAETHRPLITQKILKSWIGPLVARCMSKGAMQKSFTKIFGPHTPPLSEDIDVLWELLCFNQGRRILPSMLNYLNERKVYRQRWVESMQGASIPIGFINGVYDPISGLHMADRFEELIPNGICTKLECGHYPQLELPEQVLQSFLQFQQTDSN